MSGILSIIETSIIYPNPKFYKFLTIPETPKWILKQYLSNVSPFETRLWKKHWEEERKEGTVIPDTLEDKHYL